MSWYAALAYLRMGDVEATKQSLEPLTKDKKADHYEEALELIEALK